MVAPSGNAVKGASARPVLYPVQLVIMAGEATGDYIDGEVLRSGLSKSAVTRRSLEAGIELDKIATEHVIPLADLVNAARLHALKQARDASVVTQ